MGHVAASPRLAAHQSGRAIRVMSKVYYSPNLSHQEATLQNVHRTERLNAPLRAVSLPI